MKKLVTLIILTCITFNGISQNKDSLKQSYENRERKFLDRSYIGGDFIATISNYGGIINLSPLYAYRLTEKGLLGGVGFTYQYTSGYDAYYGQRFSNNLFGGRVFLRQHLGENFFLHGELEMYRTKVYVDLTGKEEMRNIPVGAAGLGYRNNIMTDSYYQIMVGYDFIQDPYTWYYVYPFPFRGIYLKAGVVIALSDLR